MSQIGPKILIRAVNTWGVEAQMMLAIEECTELIKAIIKAWRGQDVDASLIEEIADVQIMVEQLRLIVGQSKVDSVVTEKMARLEQRLEDFHKKR